MPYLWHVMGDFTDHAVAVRAETADEALSLVRSSGRFRVTDRLFAIELDLSGPSAILDGWPVNKTTFEPLPDDNGGTIE